MTNNIWLFNSADQFAGNVKYAFLYFSENHPELECYYITASAALFDKLKSKNIKVAKFNTNEGKELIKNAHVYVCEQCKENYPEEFLDNKTIILNLYHGVGLKNIEREYTGKKLGAVIAKKWIRYTSLFENNMLFLVTSPAMEKHFTAQVGLKESQIVRAGYPRNVYHLLRKSHEIDINHLINDNSKKILYAPTFRDNQADMLDEALEDISRLDYVLEKKNLFLFIKLHPLTLKSGLSESTQLKLKNAKKIKLWPENEDVYDYFDQFDCLIYDYSSIFYDALEFNIKNYIRYIWDIEKYAVNFNDDYISNTCGLVAQNFDQLIECIDRYSEVNDDSETKIQELKKKYWEYSSLDTFEIILQHVNKFKVKRINNKILYSYDIWDTVVTRNCGLPIGIFYKVQSLIKGLHFPQELIDEFPIIRREAEQNVRERLKRTAEFREELVEEISIFDIYNRIQEIYNLTLSQVNELISLEFKAELDSARGNLEIIDEIKTLREQGENIILVSDMYWPGQYMRQILEKVSSDFSNIPIFISADYKVQKANGNLFVKIFQKYGTNYHFSKWIHTGDNKISDLREPTKLGIQCIHRPFYPFNKFEQEIINKTNSYDGFVLANNLRLYREKTKNCRAYYVYAHICGYFVPYINWVVNSAIKQEFDTLYFISRDGFFLKLIADEIIKKEKLSLKTKYIFGSRRSWRIPSQVNSIDKEFWGSFGNFTGVSDIKKFLSSLGINESQFQEIFGTSKFEIKNLKTYINTAKNSDSYHNILLKNSSLLREKVAKYLNQEIDKSEKFAFVEFWARGYTQDCLNSLLKESGIADHSYFYYFRSIESNRENSIRFNYSTYSKSLIFSEVIFANNPYESLRGYAIKGGVVVPRLEVNQDFMPELFFAMKEIIPQFISENKLDNLFVLREYSRIAMDWFHARPDDADVARNFGALKYSQTMWGSNNEFAPAFTKENIDFLNMGGDPKAITNSLKMSLARTPIKIRAQYQEDVKRKAPSTSVIKPISKKEKLLNKLNSNFSQYCYDSSNLFLKMMPLMVKIPILGKFTEKQVKVAIASKLK